MRRVAALLLLWLLAVPAIGLGQTVLPSGPDWTETAAGEPASSPLALAVIAIRSHGCSGTVIATGPGWSDVLSCAHMFYANDGHSISQERLHAALHTCGPAQPYARTGRCEAHLVRVDYRRDLSLIRIDNGPYYCCPVAPAGYQPSRRLLSVGYDEMRWPAQQRWADVLSVQGDHVFTRQMPWHGRSGGGLLDPQGQCLVGVVEAYETPPPHRGLYVSLQAVHEFLAECRATATSPTPRPRSHALIAAPVPQSGPPVCGH